jgi:hypothetical protein
MKSWRTCHECRPKKGSAPNLRKPSAPTLAGEIKQFDCQSRERPRASEELPGLVSTSGHCHWETPLTPFLAHFFPMLARRAEP